MKNMIMALTFLHMFLLTTPNKTPADQVNKNSVILKEVRELKNTTGVLIAEEWVYGGGIAGYQSTQTPDNKVHGATLREFRSPKGSFDFSKGKTTITVKTIPVVGEVNHKGMWDPAIGRWEFQSRESNSYESVIHVEKGGDLDIAYQSTEMKIGKQKDVLHYGLNGNPHAISLSRKRLKNAFTSEISSSQIKPILNYQPPDDIILVQMELTPEGLLFQPIFDYQVIKH